MEETPRFVCILGGEDEGTAREETLLAFRGVHQDIRERPTTILADGQVKGSTTVSIRRLFLQLYRKHKLGGPKTLMYLSHDEHLVAVQLSIAEWNKQEKGVYEADVRSVLRASKAILTEKIRSFTKNKGEKSPPRRIDKRSPALTPKNRKPSLGVRSVDCAPESSDKSLLMASPLAMRTPTNSGISRLHQLRDSPHTPRVPFPHTPMTPSPGVQIVGSPGTPTIALNSEVVAELLTIYDDFVKKCGKLDVADVYRSVREHFEANENERQLYLKQRLFLIDGAPRQKCEREMVKYLVGEQPILCLSPREVPVDGLCWEGVPGEEQLYEATEPVSYLWRSPDLREHLSHPVEPESRERVSVSERFIRKLFFSYLSLLVNSSDELALARCLCLPDRGLGHDGFTALKHVAQQKNMSMFLTAFSFVFELRRVKRPSDSYSDLFAHTKPLGEFVDIADKLMTTTQDIADVDRAAEKVLKTLRVTLSKSKTCVLRAVSVQKVHDELLAEVRRLTNEKTVNLNLTPKPVGSGGSMRGQKVLKLFRAMIDIEATDVTQNQGFEELADQQSSQRTPVRLPSIFSQFRSPSVQEQPDDGGGDSAGTAVKRTPDVSYTKTHYGWVNPSMCQLGEPFQLPVQSLGRNNHRGPRDATAEPPDPPSGRVPLGEITEEMEADSAGERNKRLGAEADGVIANPGRGVPGNERTTPSMGKVKKNTKQALKRKKLELEGGARSRKKPKKKEVPLQKGQKLLSNFFGASKT